MIIILYSSKFKLIYYNHIFVILLDIIQYCFQLVLCIFKKIKLLLEMLVQLQAALSLIRMQSIHMPLVNMNMFGTGGFRIKAVVYYFLLFFFQNA